MRCGGHTCVEHTEYVKWDVYAWEGFGPVTSLRFFSRADQTSDIHHHVQAQRLAPTETSDSCLQGAGSCFFLLLGAIKDGGCYQH